MKKSLLLTFLLLALVWTFEYLPVVEQARKAFPDAFGDVCGCACVLKSRPWHGQVNPWFWLWIVFTPIMVFSAAPSASVWQRAGRHVFIIILSYAVLHVAAVKLFDIRNAPFYHSDITGSSSAAEVFKFNCYASDGLLYAFSIALGWLPATIYAGWWEIAWSVYHRRKTRLIHEHFKRDWVSRIIVCISWAIPALLALWTGIAGYR